MNELIRLAKVRWEQLLEEEEVAGNTAYFFFYVLQRPACSDGSGVGKYKVDGTKENAKRVSDSVEANEEYDENDEENN